MSSVSVASMLLGKVAIQELVTDSIIFPDESNSQTAMKRLYLHLKERVPLKARHIVASAFSTSAPPMFTGKNYVFWSVEMQSYLRAFNRWDVVETRNEPVQRHANSTLAQIRQFEEDKAKRTKIEVGNGDFLLIFGVGTIGVQTPKDRACIVSDLVGIELFTVIMRNRYFPLNWMKLKQNVYKAIIVDTDLWHKSLVQYEAFCYSKIPDAKRSKLDEKSLVVDHLSYSEISKGYGVFDVKTWKVLVSRDVRFDETIKWNWETLKVESSKVNDIVAEVVDDCEMENADDKNIDKVLV
ncbi:Uncharacterized protein TCM_032051 [Theobroma cacao]|uniref:Retroviral polymerase SH3-like domain-containing protein n=1 Tax=Theobroma cacao TaxID=3641 RepID=A0A061F996_THECC|nr:Uncharacterized protein TCM_032051 [Theobroma cacao]